MMRLIDSDSLETHEIYEGEWVDVVYADDIEDAPTIDAVPVVRCRDCKYYNHEKDEDRWDSESCNHPLFDVSDPYECYVLRVEPDDFCSRGERRTDETD